MIELVRTLGTSPNGPKVYVLTPPPLMKNTVYGMKTVINRVLPGLSLRLARPRSTGLLMSLTPRVARPSAISSGGCTLTSTLPTCPLWCDKRT